MNADQINAKIYAGRANAAIRIGQNCDLFRPVAAGNPLAPSSRVAGLKAAFNALDGSYMHANMPGKSIWYADLDGRITQPGDYLVRQFDGTMFFIAGQQQLLPIIVVQCDRMVTVSRQTANTTFGAAGYSGVTAASKTPIVGTPTGMWPASILQGGGGGTALNLPADAKAAGWAIMLPPSVPVTILAADFINDDLGRAFMVDSAELTDLGWRINAHELHT